MAYTWTNTNPAAVLDATKHSHLDKVYNNTFALDAGERFHGAKVYRSANKSISNITTITIDWDTEQYDTDGFHSTTVNNSRLSQVTGFDKQYYINALVLFDANATGYRTATGVGSASMFFLPQATDNSPSASQQSALPLAGQITLYDASSYTEVSCYQSSGGALNVLCGGGAVKSYFAWKSNK